MDPMHRGIGSIDPPSEVLLPEHFFLVGREIDDHLMDFCLTLDHLPPTTLEGAEGILTDRDGERHDGRHEGGAEDIF